jgi:hypothetical protein
MNKARITQIGRELESRLSVFFSDKSYTTCCGKHWHDRSKTPDQVAEDSIKVKMTQAIKPEWTSGVVQLDYTIRSEQPSHVFAGFNMSRKGETGAHHSIAEFMMDTFKVPSLVNSGIEFTSEPHVWFVIKDLATKYYFHVHLYPKFGHGS